MQANREAVLLGVLLILAVFALPADGESLPPLSPAPGDKCPVCGMFVAKYPDWTAQVRFEDRRTAFFDGAKDLFKYLLEIGSYHPGRTPADIAAVYVTDYYTLAPVNAKEAFFVVGSDVYGPMGRELIAFSTSARAEEFMDDHKGQEIIRFDAVTADLLQTLD